MLSSIKEFKEVEIKRIMRKFDSKAMDDRLVNELEEILILIFGVREGENAMTTFLRDKQVNFTIFF